MRSFFKKFSIIDYIDLFCLGIIIVFYILAFNKTPYKIQPLIHFIVLLGIVVLMSQLRSKNKFGSWQQVFNLAYPAFFIVGMFETFFMILPYFNSTLFDELMAKIDFWIFGLNPTVWLEGWTHPVLTDLFYLFYIVYFPMPLFIIIWLLRKKMFNKVGEAVFIYSFTYFGAYFIYFLVPVQGPRFFLKDLQTISLEGIILAEPISKIIDFLEPNKLDAFPSLHTSVIMITMFICFRHHKKMFFAFTPIAVGILISLVYCRYHYFIDMFVGLVWAIFAYFLAVVLYSKFSHKFYFHFSQEEK